MDNISLQKPCVVETPQGFSVSYKEHLLYSKYNPSKTILQSVEKLQLMPGTIILGISPVLGYGVQELLRKLPENCLLILCEADKELYDFSLKYINNLPSNCIYIHPENLNNLPLLVYDLCRNGSYRRVISQDFSTGSQFFKEYYNQLSDACSNSIGTFWKNRITLTKFGRKYSHNFFTNLKLLPASTPIKAFYNTVNKPILVVGAGQSVDLFFQNTSINPKDYFILCADTSLIPLQKRNIIPDGVFIEEAQAVISKAFIGANPEVHYFAGLSSIPFLYSELPANKLSFFATEYTNASFLDEISRLNIIPEFNKPFGSVGLTTVFYALKFRKNQNIPVYTVGLDFSYTAGFTHTKNALAHITRLTQTNRLVPVANYGAAFNASSIKITGKNNQTVFTTKTLSTYAALFNHIFAGEPNLFDSGDCGLPLAIIHAKPLNSKSSQDAVVINAEQNSKDVQELKDYLSKEKKELLELRALLTGEKQLKAEEQQALIKKIAANKEYLYLHFADGYCFAYNQSFLNRIRTEIDFFLKIFD